MIDPTRTPFAPGPTPAATVCPFPEARIVRHPPVAVPGDDEVVVEHRGQVMTFRNPAALVAHFTALTPGDQLRQWGWLLVLGLCAVAVVVGAL